MKKPRLDKATLQWRLELGARLQGLRETICGWSMNGGYIAFEPLLSTLRVSRSSWAHCERGKAMPPEVMLSLIIDLNVSPRWLRSGTGTMFANNAPPTLHAI